MSRKKKIVGSKNEERKYYELRIILNKERDKEIIAVIQKIPYGRRTSVIRSALYMNLVIGAKVSHDEEAGIQKKNIEGKTPKNADVKSQVASFVKMIEGKRDKK